MRIGIAADHGGFALKEELRQRLAAAGHEIVDFGAKRLEPGDDYPDFVTPLARAVAAGKVARGVAVCGSGVGASVCANKVLGVRRPNQRSLLGATRRRGRPHEYYLSGRQSHGHHGGLGSRRNFSPSRIQPSRAALAPSHQSRCIREETCRRHRSGGSGNSGLDARNTNFNQCLGGSHEYRNSSS
jgi:hypothetical protein